MLLILSYSTIGRSHCLVASACMVIVASEMLSAISLAFPAILRSVFLQLQAGVSTYLAKNTTLVQLSLRTGSNDS